jgi:hypothetical protein
VLIQVNIDPMRSWSKQLFAAIGEGVDGSPRRKWGTYRRPHHCRRPKTCTQAVISLHAQGPDLQALGSVDNDDGLCPKPAYLQAPWIIGKRAFETDYCASLPGTAILAFKPRENPVNVG